MVEKLVLGTVQMGIPYGINNAGGRISQSESLKIFELAHSAGIRLLDTAEAYGEAHSVIGSFHKTSPHLTFDIVTKIPKSIGNERIESRINKYLEELKVERLWSLMFHSFSTYSQNSGLLNNLLEIKEKGVVQHLGVSIYTNEEFLKVIADPNIEVIQLPFNLLDNYSIKGDLMKKAKEKGKILHTRSAFLQGLFFMDRTKNDPVLQELKLELKMIDGLASELGIDVGALALGYCLAQSEIDNVLIGVDSLSQLNLNLQSTQQSVTSGAVELINQIMVKNLDLLNPSLWK